MANLRDAATRILKKAKKPGTPSKTAAAKAASGADAANSQPVATAISSMVLADIALRGGGALLRRAVEQGLLGREYGAANVKKIIKGRSMAQTLVGAAIARIATRSVPGAIIIGGSLLAKTLYDRQRAKHEAEASEQKVGDEPAGHDQS